MRSAVNREVVGSSPTPGAQPTAIRCIAREPLVRAGVDSLRWSHGQRQELRESEPCPVWPFKKRHAVAVYDTRPQPGDDFEPYIVAICECGWIGDFHDDSTPAFRDANEHVSDDPALVDQVVDDPSVRASSTLRPAREFERARRSGSQAVDVRLTGGLVGELGEVFPAVVLAIR